MAKRCYLVGYLVMYILLTLSRPTCSFIRQFHPKPGPGCSTITAQSALGCPCRLEGQRCRDDGSRCIKGSCQCGPSSQTITLSGQKSCLPLFFVIPTIEVSATSLYGGATVPCSLPATYAIPGFNLTFVNAQRPVYCGDDILYITAEAEGPITTDIDPVLGPGVSYIDIDPNTGEVVPRDTVNSPSGTGTYLTETYTGYCIDSRGISSNTFTFKLTFANCNPSGRKK